MELCRIGLVLSLIAAPGLAAPAAVLYDQRQDGQLNVHAQLEKLVVVVIPGSKPPPTLYSLLAQPSSSSPQDQPSLLTLLADSGFKTAAVEESPESPNSGVIAAIVPAADSAPVDSSEPTAPVVAIVQTADPVPQPTPPPEFSGPPEDQVKAEPSPALVEALTASKVDALEAGSSMVAQSSGLTVASPSQSQISSST